MATLNTIPTMPLSLKAPLPHLTCSSFAHAKQRPASHKPNTKEYEVGSYVSSDTCGPINPTSRHGNKHFLTFMDAASRYLILYFIKDRREVALIITILFAWLHSHRTTPQTYRTDNAKEFCSKDSKAIYMRYGIEHKTTTPHQPQENSRAERINQTLLNAARAALHHANLDNTHWEDAVRDAAFKYNIMFHSAHGMSPYERWHNRKPSIKRLFSFGQKGHITIHSPKKKLQPRAAPAQYMYGSSETHICVLNLHTGKYQTIRASDFHPYDPHSDPVNYNTQAFRTISPTQNSHHPDPQSHNQAKRFDDAPQWAIAHDHELDNIDATKTIEWIPDEQIPRNTKIIPLKMTYKYKHTTTGDIRRKARCSVRGDRMKPGIHFDPDNTTTYMAEKTTVRLLLSEAAAHCWPIEHFDITTAYLHEQYNHKQPVYVKQHARFDGSYKHNCKAGILRGNLYGTPPASNIYFTGLVKHLLAANYTQCQADPCLFYKTNNSTGDTILVAISMDDFLATSPNRELIDSLYNHLHKKYNIKRLGTPSLYLNWHVQATRNGGIHISQPHTIETILAKTNMTHCNPKHTPLPEKIDQHAAISATLLSKKAAAAYRETIGDLRYIADSTRPDIYHAVNRLATTMHAPTQTHWQHLKWKLRYLKHTKQHGILFRVQPRAASKPILSSFSDADYANAPGRKSYTGTVHKLYGAPIAWTSSKQSVVALSTCEAEYLAASTAVQQTNWLRRLLTECTRPLADATPLFTDNNSAIQVAKNTAPTKRRKLIDIRHHHLHDNIARNEINVHHIPSTSNLADLFTKPIGRQRFHELLAQMSFTPPPTEAPDRVVGTGD